MKRQLEIEEENVKAKDMSLVHESVTEEEICQDYLQMDRYSCC